MPLHASYKLGGISLGPSMHASLVLWVYDVLCGIRVGHERLVCGIRHVVLVVKIGVPVLD